MQASGSIQTGPHWGECGPNGSPHIGSEILQIGANGRGSGEQLRCQAFGVEGCQVDVNFQALQAVCYFAEPSECWGANEGGGGPGLAPAGVIVVQTEALPVDQRD